MKKNLLFLLVLTAVFLVSCGGENYLEDSFFVMDTIVTLRLDTDDTGVSDQCRELLMELDSTLSRHNTDGQISKFNGSLQGCALSDEAIELISTAIEIEKDTDGLFSVFSGSLTDLWSGAECYPDGEAAKKAVESVCAPVKINGVFLEKTSAHTKLEFGGIAKGYACDKAVELLKSKGLTSGMVSFASSIGVFGNNPQGDAWRIAVRDPFDTQRVLGYISMTDGFLSVSGDYERWFTVDGKRYNHIIDPRSGLPVDNGVRSVAVVAESGVLSDALSTAIFVMGREAAEKKYADDGEIGYLIVTDDGVFLNDTMKKYYSAE